MELGCRTRFGSARGIAGKAPTDIGDLYSRAAARTRGFFRGVRVGATRIRCGPMLMPLRSSYRAPAYPARALASAAAEHVPALDDELGERVLDRRARLLRPVKQRRRRSIQRYRFPCEHHDFEVADAAPGRCSRTEPGIPRAATQGASRCGRDVSPIADCRARVTGRRLAFCIGKLVMRGLGAPGAAEGTRVTSRTLSLDA